MFSIGEHLIHPGQGVCTVTGFKDTPTPMLILEAGSGHDLTVSIGTTVELEDEKGSRTSFTIVGTTETNSLEHKISNESPVGAALVGHKEGDKIEVVAPSGRSRSYTITAISR